MASTGADLPLTGLAEPLGSPRPWRVGAGLASAADRVEAFIASRPFERGPWVAVAFAAGIGAWFVLPDVGRWLAWLPGFAGLAFAGPAAFGREGRHPLTLIAIVATALMLAAGMATVRTKSALVGAEALERPQVTTLTGRIVEREEQGAEDRVRLTPAARGIEGRETARVSSGARCSRPAGASASWSATGGLAFDLRSGRVTSVAESQGGHGWWRPPVR